jgi:hypothetical protein
VGEYLRSSGEITGRPKALHARRPVAVPAGAGRGRGAGAASEAVTPSQRKPRGPLHQRFQAPALCSTRRQARENLARDALRPDPFRTASRAARVKAAAPAAPRRGRLDAREHGGTRSVGSDSKAGWRRAQADQGDPSRGAAGAATLNRLARDAVLNGSGRRASPSLKFSLPDGASNKGLMLGLALVLRDRGLRNRGPECYRDRRPRNASTLQGPGPANTR